MNSSILIILHIKKNLIRIVELYNEIVLNILSEDEIV